MSKHLSGILSGLIIAMFIFSGCRREKVQVIQEPPVFDEGITVSNNITVSGSVIITGSGQYEAAGTKKVMLTASAGDKKFDVIDKDTDKVVYSGEIRFRRGETDKEDVGEGDVGLCDLTEVNKEGSYYIKTNLGAESEVFAVSEGLYKKLLSDRLSYFGGQSADEEITEDNIGESFMRITDRILAQEFFPDAISPGTEEDERIVPRTMLLAKADMDVLKGFYNADDLSAKFLHSDTGKQYQYAAVFSMFAYNYDEFDKEYASECVKIAEAVYDIAEKNYEKGMYSATDTCDDKRFWAAAQLYKLTGKKEYKLTAESYAGKNAKGLQKGFNERSSGYFGSVAYLTCYHKIDLDVAEIFITGLINDINTIVKKSSEDPFLAAASGKSEEGSVKKIFENARLVVLGNYISKSITYVECGENQLAYLYGRNALGKDYAFDPSSEFYNEPQEFILAGLIDSYIYEDKEPEAKNKKQIDKTGKKK